MLGAGERHRNKARTHRIQTEAKLDKRGSSQAFKKMHQQQQPFATSDFIIPDS